MGRLVKPPSGPVVPAGGGGGSSDDKYASRVAKYIPGESVAAFVAVKAYIEDRAGMAPAAADMWMNVTAVVVLLVTPVYLWRQRDKRDPWRLNAALATAAFPIWGAALGCKYGWFALIPPSAAAVLLILYTFVAGALIPKPKP